MTATMTARDVDRLIDCDAPVRGPDGPQRCGRPAWRVYRDTSGLERGFCTLADHAWSTTSAYPPVAGTQRRLVVERSPDTVITNHTPRKARQ